VSGVGGEKRWQCQAGDHDHRQAAQPK
jgi:hypothetical protein